MASLTAALSLFFSLLLLLLAPSTADFSFESDDVDCARVPPSMWCGCEKLASKCGWTSACQRYTQASNGKPVHLTLLYESLCLGCQKLITTSLIKAYNVFKDYISVELIPYGNAKIDSSGIIECQHGPDECKINKYESCAIHYMPEPLPFIACLEEELHNQSSLDLEKAARKCYAKFHPLPHLYDQIVHCFNGPFGNTLQQQAAKKTDQVWPDKHEWVPWLLINNVSISSQQFVQADIPMVICQAYVGDAIKDTCEAFGHSHRSRGH